ncbi:hypothetical protein CSB37_02940 [bacterium DOLZORAL124_38_8]|nr:MAG: hypothetical protein CSB37_02940 [bacterium DOLZORAL124_38_8]
MPPYPLPADYSFWADIFPHLIKIEQSPLDIVFNNHQELLNAVLPFFWLGLWLFVFLSIFAVVFVFIKSLISFKF